jgi:hypothetical protein
MIMYASFRAGDDAGRKETSMSGPYDTDPALLKRRRLIERLNAREAELAASQSGQPHSEEGPEDQIEKERQRNYVRMGFAQMWWG